MDIIKKIVKFLIFLLPWFIGGLVFSYNDEFYSTLSIPSFALSGKYISIIWVIIYILIALSIYKVSKTTKILKNNDYLYVLLTNYLANMTFPYFFFTLRSPFLGFLSTVIVFVSAIFLFLETKNIKKEASYYLIPYLVYNLYALILSTLIYLMNF